MTKPEVIVVNLSSSGSRIGGAAIAAEWHSRYLAASGLSVELWKMWDRDNEYSIENLKIREYKTYSLLDHFNSCVPQKVISTFYTSQILEDLLAYKPKIIHLQNSLPSLEFERIAYRAFQSKIKILASSHGFYEVFHPEGYGIKNWFVKKAWDFAVKYPIQRSLRFLDRIFVGSPFEKDFLIHLGVKADKIQILANGINPFFLSQPTTTECNQVIHKFRLNQEKPILLFIGNHTANKGLDTVMQVANQLSIPATVVIGGRLQTLDEPFQWRTKLPPNHDVDVVFTDYLSLREQRALYYLSTLLLFPSVSDTLPLTIIEAMACGLPVVAYDVGGIAYQLANHSGVVIPKGEFVAYLQAVESLLANSEERVLIAQNAKVRQRTIFSWESAAQKTIRVYETLFD
jgi:glycosyltransferase involved in cell wall biosynthesis